MPLVINTLGRGHKHAHTKDLHNISFKKPGVRRPQASVPGLKPN